MPVLQEATVVKPEPLPDFVSSPSIEALAEQALNYIHAGFPVHFRGATGTGKTTMAMHVAHKLGNPVVLIHGNDEANTSDLVGGEYGYSMKKVIDRFIRSVLKTSVDVQRRWVDHRLTLACRHGFTLIYDEYNRARPETNNVLLSVLQEKVLDLPAQRKGDESYLTIHPNFVALFTSNPQEYAGVHRTQDALRDRMVTIDLDSFDREDEVRITEAKGGVRRALAEKIVDVVRALRESGQVTITPTVRTAIAIAKTIQQCGNGNVDLHGPLFAATCENFLASQSSRTGNREEREKIKECVRSLLAKQSK